MSEHEVATVEQAVKRLLDVANGRWNAYHNLIIEASGWGPERFVALAQAEAAQAEMWAAVVVGLAAAQR